MKKKKIVTVIQARTGSTRLPNKVFLPLAGEPLLYRMYERVISSPLSGTVVIAIPNETADDPIETFCKEKNILLFRGDSFDLLDRHYRAGLKYEAEVVIKIPSDCPLIDPDVISKTINFYLDNSDKYDYVSNLHPQSYPDGNDVEIQRF